MQRNRQYLIELRMIIDSQFNKEELRILCFDLGVDYDNLIGESKAAKIVDLLSYLERSGEVHKAIEALTCSRPDIQWPEVIGEPSITKPEVKVAPELPPKKPKLRWVWMIGIVGLIAAVSLVIWRIVTLPTQATRFSDSFSNNETQLSWSTGRGGNIQLQDGQFRVYAEPWGENVSRNWKTLVKGGPDATETYWCEQCSVQVDVSIPDVDTPRGAGIVFGYKDSLTFYQFSVLGSNSDSDDGYYKWSILQGDPDAEYGVSYLSPPTSWSQLSPVSDTFTLRVGIEIPEVEDEQNRAIAYCYVNGVRIGVVPLSNYAGGRVGLVAIAPVGEGGAVLYDDFLVADFSEE